MLLARTIGAPDAATGSLLVELARGADIVFDIGANVGAYTYLVAAAAPRARVVSVEPVPALAALIADNIRRNGWQSRVAVHQQAVAAASGRSVLYVLPDADMEHTMSFERVAGRAHRALDVSLVSIDDLVIASGAPPDRTVLKIDVEGYEQAALAGMERTLGRRGRRPDLVIELLGHAIVQEHVIDRLLARGLDVYYIGPTATTRLRATADLDGVHALGFWNFLVTSRLPRDVADVAARAGVRLRA